MTSLEEREVAAAVDVFVDEERDLIDSSVEVYRGVEAISILKSDVEGEALPIGEAADEMREHIRQETGISVGKSSLERRMTTGRWLFKYHRTKGLNEAIPQSWYLTAISKGKTFKQFAKDPEKYKPKTSGKKRGKGVRYTANPKALSALRGAVTVLHGLIGRASDRYAELEEEGDFTNSRHWRLIHQFLEAGHAAAWNALNEWEKTL